MLKTKLKVIGLKADVCDYKQQQEAVKTTEETLGNIDIVIANAGFRYFRKHRRYYYRGLEPSYRHQFNGSYFIL